MEFNETWQEASSQRPLPSFAFFWADRKKTRWPPWSLISWEIFDFSSENRWTEFNETWQEAISQCPLPSLCFFGPIGKNKMAALASDWLRTFSTSPLKTAERNSTKLDRKARSQCPLPSLCFFGPIGKTRLPPWPLIGWDILTSPLKPLKRNSTKLDRKQDRKRPLPSLCFFGPIRKNKIAALASDRLRHFRLLLWNRLTEFNETWQEARSQRLLPSLCFSGRWVNKNFCPGWSVKKVAHCTQVHDMWPFGASC